MLLEERFSRILHLLKQKGTVSVTELSSLLHTSESTIRRDIAALSRQGKLKKVYGGAKAVDSTILTSEFDVQTKSAMNVEEKTKIAQYAATTIQNDDFVYIDAGTTTLLMLDYIDAPNAVFVTNGIPHAKKLIQKGYQAYVTGGQIKLATEAIVGAESVQSIQKYNFTKCFMGTNGIDIKRGFTTPNIDEALIKGEAVRRSYMAYVLADHTKFRQVSSVTFASLSDACIITDQLNFKEFEEYTVIKAVNTDHQ